MNHGSLFSGIGGFDLGFERAGIRTLWQVEIDPYCRRVLAKNFPGSERFSDIRECGAHNLAPVDILSGGFPCQDISNAGKRAGIDGERSGLWSEYARIIRELRPRYVVVENVAALLGRGMGRVLGDLAALGYDAEWQSIRASDVGAPHRRERIWIVAYPHSQRRCVFHESQPDVERYTNQPAQFCDWQGQTASEVVADAQCGWRRQPAGDSDSIQESLCPAERTEGAFVLGSGRKDVADADGGRLAVQRESSGRSGFAARGGETLADSQSHLWGASGDERSEPPDGCGPDVGDSAEPGLSNGTIFPVGEPGADAQLERSDWWAVEPGVGRVAHGIPARVDRLRGLGNAIVPQIAEWIGKRLMEVLA